MVKLSNSEICIFALMRANPANVLLCAGTAIHHHGPPHTCRARPAHRRQGVDPGLYDAAAGGRGLFEGVLTVLRRSGRPAAAVVRRACLCQAASERNRPVRDRPRRLDIPSEAGGRCFTGRCFTAGSWTFITPAPPAQEVLR